MENIFKKFEDAFYKYTKKYDKNIIELIKEKDVNISLEQLKEILNDAKQRI